MKNLNRTKLALGVALAMVPLGARAQISAHRGFGEPTPILPLRSPVLPDTAWSANAIRADSNYNLRSSLHRLTTEGSSAKTTFPKRTLIGAAMGGLLGLGVCAVLAEGSLASDRDTLIGFVSIPAFLGGLIGYTLEK
jgi:hypothetical protein